MPFRRRKQKAFLYKVTRYDANGEPVLDDPIELAVRIERGNPLGLTPTSSTIVFDATMWVACEITVGSIVYLGDEPIADPDNLKRVVDYQEIPNVKGTKFERIVLLNKWSDRLPS